MPNLRQTQSLFLDAVLDPGGAGPAPWIAGGELSPEKRLLLYRDQILTNWEDALGNVFPVVSRLVGASFFNAAARRFSLLSPAKSGDLRGFGRGFPDFLKGWTPAATLVYLPDVARLEWAVHTVLEAPEAPPLDLDRLAGTPVDQYHRLRFRLHPACQLLSSPYPVDRIWEVNQEGVKDPPVVRLEEGGALLLIRRKNLNTAVRRLSAPVFAFLAAVARGFPLDRACAAALTVDSGFVLEDPLRSLAADSILIDGQVGT
ncbi:MAG: DUF2063 domain-containing protein [Nitrospinaceae bacterium]